MVAQVHPFRKFTEKSFPWLGVKAPDLHPLAAQTHLKNNFADGGLIGEEVIPSEPPVGAAVSAGGVRSFNKGGKVAVITKGGSS